MRYALRSLLRTPGFAAVAIGSLALGIGVNSTIFNALNALALRPLPYANAERLFDVSEDNPKDLCAGCGVGMSYPAYTELKTRTRSFARLEASIETSFTIAGEGEPERAGGAQVSAGVFSLLGVRPALGRGFTEEDDQVGAAPVVVLEHGLWQRRFGADSGVLGRSVRLNGITHQVIGVMPSRFGFPERAHLWTPLAPARAADQRDDRSLGVIGLLRSDLTLDRANLELATLARQQAEERPEVYRNWTIRAVPYREASDDPVGSWVGLIQAAAAFVLLIACANLANLLLARASARDREVAVRFALGASRGRIIRHFLAESLVLALLGGAVGLGLSLWGIRVVLGLIPVERPFWLDFRVDWRVVLFTLGATLLAALASGIAPALEAARTNVHDALKAGALTTTTSRGRRRLRSVLVVTQVALAIVLLSGAGLVVKSFAVVSRTDNLGYDPRGILRAELHLEDARYREGAQARLFAANLLDQLAALPRSPGVALERGDFLGTFVGTASRVSVEGAAEPVPNSVAPRFANAVTPEYFTLLDIPILKGRAIAAADLGAAPAVAVISTLTAERLWPGQDPLGKRLRLDLSPDAPWLTVVGVVGNVIGSVFGRTVTPMVYTSLAQFPGSSLTVLVEPAQDPAALAAPLRSAVAQVDPDVPVENVSPMEQALADWALPLRFMLGLMGSLGVLALGLAAFGLYGVMAYLVARRVREMGVRMALGASPGAVRWLVLRRGLALTGLGAAIGIPAALALTQALRGILLSVSASDPAVYLGVVALLLAVAFVACAVPARRATRADPVEALRSE